jgi:hypothetical protein
MSAEMPSPPFPDPDSACLALVIARAVEILDRGDARAAILSAAVHGWYEGHVHGEDACPGCTFRGDAGPSDPTGRRERLVRQLRGGC